MPLKRLTTCAATLALAAMAASGCTVSQSSGPGTAAGNASKAPENGIPKGPITIGMPIALTGAINLYDGDTLIGARTAVKEINDAGGVDGHPLKLVTADTKSDIAQGGAAALKVIARDAQFIIPTLDYNYGGGAARVAMQHDMIAVSSAGDLRFGLSIGKYMFNLYGGAPNEGSVLAQFAKQKNYKSVYVLTDTSIGHETSVCGAFKEVARKLGIDVKQGDTFQQSDTSIATQVTSVRSAQAKVDAVMMCSYPPGGSSALRQLRSGGITKPILLDQPFDGNMWEKAVPKPGETYVVSLGVITPGQDKNPVTSKVYKAAAAYTGKPLTFAQGILTGYGAVQAIADGVKATNSVNGDKIAHYFETWDKHKIGYGPTTWTPQCHVAAPRPMQIASIAHNELRYVTAITPTTLPSKVC
ncbi:ABC transporter substrate-binding protein [Streptomyces sp. AgN23]|uniref:ABC transporter substrate-binding protein n=1 Tax=Streptomyces sp. AgN23 TaxID=1188315 RepID=UPI001B333036|nr:ABC transporter substrate-binding protein [Streptomyces sp. AgN23]QTI87262.1 ABC transporter substrate-binding protein [Streptomyces sp. AgN23]